MDPLGDRKPDRNQVERDGLEPGSEVRVDALDQDVRRMLAFRAGDESAFNALFDRWSGPLLRYLERMLHDAAAAEELVQEVFLRVHRARERYRPEARFSTWLYRIATRLALNELRRPRRRELHQSLDAEGAAPLAGDEGRTDEIVDARRRAAAVEESLAALPERQRAALWLAVVDGLSYAEVAGVLEVSESAVKSLVHRARSGLAERLGDSASPLGGRNPRAQNAQEE